jgi:hypothetical protein
LSSWRRGLAGAGAVAALGLLLSVAAPAAPPTLAVVASDAVIGGTIHATAELSESPNATGEISFEVFGSGDPTCSQPPLTQSAATVSGEGQYVSGDFTPPAAGAYYWSAHYSGDGENPAADSDCSATSTVAKAAPGLSGSASSAAVGTAIHDEVTLSGGFSPSGEVTFSVYGPTNAACATPLETTTAPIEDGHAISPDFSPQETGEFRWTASYPGDANNEAADLACGAADQSSAVGTIDVTLAVSATGGAVGDPIEATATIQKGASPTGQITFKAFSPGDTNCSGAAAFSSEVKVSGNGSYSSATLVATRAGSFRWTVAYSGDPNHAPTTAGCGKAVSRIAQARPSIAGTVPHRIAVGTSFRDTATLQGGYVPGGTITFRIYGPVKGGCTEPAFVNTVAVTGNGRFSSDPFVTLRTGRYSFVASYSGDTSNQAASEPCDSAAQVVQVRKRAPKVTPRAQLVGERQISIRARLSGGLSPAGAISFRLYGPGDKRCRHKPAFAGGITVKSNGTFPLARYIATQAGVYRLGVGYSGDQRNRRYQAGCSGAQSIRVR